MTLKPAGSNKLRLEFFRHFPDRPNTANFGLTYDMARVAGATPDLTEADKSQAREDCVGFDAGRVQSGRWGSVWRVVSSAVWLVEASNRDVTDKGVKVIKNYGFDTQCSVGAPDAPMHYYLVKDKAPSGPMQGEECIAFKAEGLRAKKGKLESRDGVLVFDFRGDNGEAKRAAKLIKKYGFGNVCYMSRDNPQLTYFRK